MRNAGKILGREQTVAGAAHESVRIDLPAATGVGLLFLDHRIVGIAVARVRGWLAEQEEIFRHSGAHAAAVLALLRPAEAIGLVVLPHYVRHDGLARKESEAVLFEGGYAVIGNNILDNS